MKKIFELHNVGKWYVQENYKEALKKLERDKMIITDPPSHMRIPRKGEVTFADDVIVTFPKKVEHDHGN